MAYPLRRGCEPLPAEPNVGARPVRRSDHRAESCRRPSNTTCQAKTRHVGRSHTRRAPCAVRAHAASGRAFRAESRPSTPVVVQIGTACCSPGRPVATPRGSVAASFLPRVLRRATRPNCFCFLADPLPDQNLVRHRLPLRFGLGDANVSLGKSDRDHRQTTCPWPGPACFACVLRLARRHLSALRIPRRAIRCQVP